MRVTMHPVSISSPNRHSIARTHCRHSTCNALQVETLCTVFDSSVIRDEARRRNSRRDSSADAMAVGSPNDSSTDSGTSRRRRLQQSGPNPDPSRGGSGGGQARSRFMSSFNVPVAASRDTRKDTNDEYVFQVRDESPDSQGFV